MKYSKNVLYLMLLPLILTSIFLVFYKNETIQNYSLLNLGFSNNLINILLLPAFSIAIGITLYMIGKSLNGTTKKTFYTSSNALLLVLTIITFIPLSGVINTQFSSENVFLKVILVSVSILMIVIGHILPKSKKNYVIGIRTKWTLNNNVIWDKTHRLAGQLIVLFSLLDFFIALAVDTAQENLVYLYFAILFIPLIVSIIYSFLLSKKKPMIIYRFFELKKSLLNGLIIIIIILITSYLENRAIPTKTIYLAFVLGILGFVLTYFPKVMGKKN